MIPRYQRVLFWLLSICIVLMALFLLHGCEQAHEKLTRHRNETPLPAPVATPSETFRLAVANDTDGSITMAERDLALPSEPSARIRALLAHLIAEYSNKNSNHPIESGPAIDDVFLLDLPLRPAVSGTNIGMLKSTRRAEDKSMTQAPVATGGQLAVINLAGSFADHHPSGIEPEMLTIQSIIGTLYTNFPRIQQVRFLVDGNSRETLAGHVDLTRVYQVVNTETSPAHASQQESR